MEKYFPVLAQGQRSSAPPRTLQGDGFLWRDSANWVVREGQLRPNLSIDSALVSQPPLNLPGSEDEIGLWISTASPSGGDWMACITDRSIFIYPNPTTGWVDCTPTYTTGTVSVTNGLTAVTGVGTAWLTRGITAGQHILPAGGVYSTIATVNNDTSITLTANYAGATAAGVNHTVIRNFIGGALRNSVRNPHVVLYNETLYVAGTYLGSANGVAAPAVIKVANVYSATPTTTYITGASALSVGLDFITGLSRISGIQVLNDSRVVISGNSNQVFYSSPTSDAVWTVTPGGSVVLTDIDGQHRALGKLGSTLTVHHARGVVLGRPTGLSDPPLTWERSGATRGAISAASLKPLNGVELFLAQDGDVKVFDLNRTFSAGGGEMKRRLLGGIFTPSAYSTFFAATDEGRNLYRLFRFGGSGNPLWIYEMDGDRWWPGSTGAHIIGGCSDILEANSVTQVTRHLVSKSARANDLLWYYNENDEAVFDSSTSVLLETDDLDFDQPLLYKALHRVVLWYTCTGTTGVRISARIEGGSWVNAPTQNLTTTSALSEGIAYFDFIDLVNAGRQIRVRITVPTPNTGCSFSPTALLVRAEAVGEVERA